MPSPLDHARCEGAAVFFLAYDCFDFMALASILVY